MVSALCMILLETTHYHGLEHWIKSKGVQVSHKKQEVESYLIGGVKQDIKENYSLDSNYETSYHLLQRFWECQAMLALLQSLDELFIEYMLDRDFLQSLFDAELANLPHIHKLLLRADMCWYSEGCLRYYQERNML